MECQIKAKNKTNLPHSSRLFVWLILKLKKNILNLLLLLFLILNDRILGLSTADQISISASTLFLSLFFFDKFTIFKNV